MFTASLISPRLQSSGSPPASRANAIQLNTRLIWIAALACTAAVYLASFGKMPLYPGFGDGPSIYIASAQSLAHGTGYRLIYYPQAPLAQLYPIGYPLLLSPIFHFIPFGSHSIFLARLLNVFSILVWAELARRLLMHVLNPVLAGLGALAIVLSPLVLEMGGEIKADLVFGAIAMLAIVVAMPALRSETNRQAFLRGAAIGILAACGMLVRTIGFTIIFGLALEMLLHRRWLRLAGFAAFSTLLLSPWILWSCLHYGGTFHAYASENAITLWTPLAHFWNLTAQTAPTILFAPIDKIADSAHGHRLHLSIIQAACGIGIVALVILGWAKLLWRRHLVALVIAPYMTIVFLWWFQPTRFVVPVLPLIVFCACEGVRSLLPKKNPGTFRAAFIAAAICIAGAFAVDFVKVERACLEGNIKGSDDAAQWSQMQQGLDWIKQNTPEDAVIFSSYPAGVYLFTGRHTLDLNNATHIGAKFTPTHSMNLDAEFQNAAVFPSVYVFATSRFDDTVKEEWGLSPVQQYVQTHPGRLQLQWAAPDGLIYLYKLR